MLCPEVWNFPQPKVIESKRENLDLISVKQIVNRNYFYKSIMVTCPDEIQVPSYIQDIIVEDSDYYKLSSCPLTELVEPLFVQSFLKHGHINCLSADRNCIIDNCVSVTPDGVLTLHVLEHIFQTLGFEGTKRPHNYYEVKIDLKCIKNYDKVKVGLSKMELFDLYITWEPNKEDICPSSIAKYFNDRDISVSVHSLNVKRITPDITEIPLLKEADVEEITEWIGMLAHNADLNPTEPYISSYSIPDCDNALKTTRISLCMIRGFIPTPLVIKLCNKLNEYVSLRETDNYWASISLQSDENSLWQWHSSSPRMFQAHDSSTNIFLTHHNHVVYSIGQIKYS